MIRRSNRAKDTAYEGKTKIFLIGFISGQTVHILGQHLHNRIEGMVKGKAPAAVSQSISQLPPLSHCATDREVGVW